MEFLNPTTSSLGWARAPTITLGCEPQAEGPEAPDQLLRRLPGWVVEHCRRDLTTELVLPEVHTVRTRASVWPPVTLGW